jgi:hypothetical protein
LHAVTPEFLDARVAGALRLAGSARGKRNVEEFAEVVEFWKAGADYFDALLKSKEESNDGINARATLHLDAKFALFKKMYEKLKDTGWARTARPIRKRH